MTEIGKQGEGRIRVERPRRRRTERGVKAEGPKLFPDVTEDNPQPADRALGGIQPGITQIEKVGGEPQNESGINKGSASRPIISDDGIDSYYDSLRAHRAPNQSPSSSPRIGAEVVDKKTSRPHPKRLRR